ncbi:MAG: nitroreductase family protein, partial [Pseudomonadota bacterium]
KLLGALPDSQGWVTGAPALLIFCGNNARQRAHHARHDLPFPNDHLDAFFNASIDAGIALATCVVAAEAAGLGCCPISTIRDAIDDVSAILGLPDHVFPVAGLALGYPARAQYERSPRLGLSATVHIDRFDQAAQGAGVTAYDARRAAQQPYAKQRDPDRFGHAPAYTWSLDKARQYSVAQRTDFGAYIRRQGFKLD